MGNNSRPSQPNQRDDVYIRKIEALGLTVLLPRWTLRNEVFQIQACEYPVRYREHALSQFQCAEICFKCSFAAMDKKTFIELTISVEIIHGIGSYGFR